MTTGELRARSVELAQASDEALDDLIEGASAYFDAETGVSFAVVAGDGPQEGPSDNEDGPTARVFYGTGTAFLRIGPFVPADGQALPSEVTMRSGVTAPAYVVDGEYLVATDAAGRRGGCATWPEGEPVTVTANWGRASVPGDVKEAVILLVLSQWQEQYAQSAKTWRGTVGVDFDIPPRALRVIERYRNRAAVLEAF